MRRRFRPRLSYANVASTLALVIALGGVSYAAATINGSSIKKRTIAGNRLKLNTVTGREVKETRLGIVRRAREAIKAGTATTAGSATTATTAGNANLLGGATPASYRDTCPSGTSLKNGACLETTLRAAATYSNAVKGCAAAGRRLPTLDELDALRAAGETVGAPGGNYERASTNLLFNQATSVDASGNRLNETYGNARQYRCIAQRTNAP